MQDASAAWSQAQARWERPLHASLGCLLALWSLLMSDHHRGTRALLRISAKVSLRGCRSCGSCGCFSTMPLASMVRTLVSLVDVPDAISLRALAGTPFNVLDSAAYSQHARVPRTSGTDIGEPALNRLFHVSCCGSSVSMRGYSLRGCIDEQECRKATDDCNLRFDVGPAVEVVTSCERSLVYPPIWR